MVTAISLIMWSFVMSLGFTDMAQKPRFTLQWGNSASMRPKLSGFWPQLKLFHHFTEIENAKRTVYTSLISQTDALFWWKHIRVYMWKYTLFLVEDTSCVVFVLCRKNSDWVFFEQSLCLPNFWLAFQFYKAKSQM